MKKRLRAIARLGWLGVELLLAALEYAVSRPAATPAEETRKRTLWLQATSRRVLRVFGITPGFTGPIPSSGLLVCNHLSYLDIPVLASLAPCAFVAKADVRRWPVFGWFARMGGTVFVHREQRHRAGEAVDEIENLLQTGGLVVLFPEGTSSGGESILPFKSSLLQPAATLNHPLTVGFLRYELPDGNVSEEVCYWKDMTLAPHLINLLSKGKAQASVHFSHQVAGSTDRKQLARELHAEAVRMQQEFERSRANSRPFASR